MYIGVLKYRMLMIQLHETDPTSPGSVGEEIASPPCESEHAMPIFFKNGTRPATWLEPYSFL
jgi:hypothetical protein